MHGCLKKKKTLSDFEIFFQAPKEPEILYYCSSVLVYQDYLRHHQTIYQVKQVFRNQRLRYNISNMINIHLFVFFMLYIYSLCISYSSKFSSKIKYVNSLAELEELIPMEYVHIPECIIK